MKFSFLRSFGYIMKAEKRSRQKKANETVKRERERNIMTVKIFQR
jgi:hypothetical protein